MDPFGYHAARVAVQSPDRVDYGDRYRAQRDELGALLRRLRHRYGRRRVFHVADVEDAIRDIRWPEELPMELCTVRRMAPLTVRRPVIDLTDDRVYE